MHFRPFLRSQRDGALGEGQPRQSHTTALAAMENGGSSVIAKHRQTETNEVGKLNFLETRKLCGLNQCHSLFGWFFPLGLQWTLSAHRRVRPGASLPGMWWGFLFARCWVRDSLCLREWHCKPSTAGVGRWLGEACRYRLPPLFGIATRVVIEVNCQTCTATGIQPSYRNNGSQQLQRIWLAWCGGGS